MRAIPERLRGVSCIGAIQMDITFTFKCLSAQLCSIRLNLPLIELGSINM